MADFATKQNIRLNHTMFRIKDPAKSLPFYTDILGMEVIRKMDMEAGKFTNYFLAYPLRTGEKNVDQFEREGVLELCHNWGTESDTNFKGYHNGNKEPQGFGHICITVDDIDASCKYFEEKGVRFQKKLTDGRMKNLAFILDPDDYWIEVVSGKKSP